MQHLVIFKEMVVYFLLKGLRISVLITFLFSLFFTSTANSQDLATQRAGTQVGYKDSPSTKITGYLVYLPQDYYDNPGKEFPVVVFLHGMGEKGNNLEYLKRLGPPMMVNKGSHFPFILISPQAQYTWDDAAPIDQLVEQVKKKLRTDPNRLYTTGVSMGGNGTFNYTFNYAHKIAASVPICGWGTASIACNAKDVPLWAFHNDGDKTVGVGGTHSMVSALEKCGSQVVKKTIYAASGHDAWTRTYNDQAMWDWMLAQSKSGVTPPPANKAPIADAGEDHTLTLPENNLTINGSGSDSDGSISKYQWTKVSGPGATMTDADKATLRLTGLLEGSYNFRLTVTDNRGASASDEVQVTVNPEPKVNETPIANAGEDQTLTLPDNSTTLVGSGSDTDGTITSYKWTKLSGPEAELYNTDHHELDVDNLVEGIYTFQLTVADDENATGTDEVKIIVNAEPLITNEPPVVDAGDDKSLTLPENSIRLSGAATDNDGSIVSYHWTKESGPEADLSGTDGLELAVSNMLEGEYIFKLTVQDNENAFASDEVTVRVSPESGTANEHPVANAGDDRSITLPENSITISGSGTDNDGAIISYNWTKSSGPEAELIDTDSKDLTIANMLEGTYTFVLTVTDNENATASDEVRVTVLAAPVAKNEAPTADAGDDKTIKLPENSIHLIGSGTDNDGAIISYQWTQVSGPEAALSTTDAAELTVSNMLEGVYIFRLTVKDNNDASASDEVKVTVNSADNNRPTVSLEDDKELTLPENSTTIKATASDSDGTIINYYWTKINGPKADFTSSNDGLELNVTNMVEGEYTFKLTVKDNDQATAADEIKIIVRAEINQRPVVNAGEDKTITLPENAVKITGIASDDDGSISNYNWTKVSGPAADLSGTDDSELNVSNMLAGAYVFKLTVKDDDGATASDEVKVFVNPKNNVAPTVSVEDDKILTLPDNNIRIKGTAIDSDGFVTTYNWVKINGPAADLYNTNKNELNVSNMAEGLYTFKLTVKDDDGATASDEIRVTVNPAPPNQKPTVNAGNDKTLTLPKNSITLIGNASDADGTIVSYAWTKTSGPGIDIATTNENKLVLTNMTAGNYVFKLTVTDDRGATASDDVKVRVNNAPTANAGYDKELTLPNNTQLLSGAGSDRDGTIVSYQWTKESGGTVTMKDAKTHLLSLSDLKEGVYIFKLVVKDNNGAAASDEVKVIVHPAENVKPIANAGEDKLLTLPENSVLLQGSASDKDGEIVDYNWVQIAGKKVELGETNSYFLLLMNLEPGEYEFKFTVADNKGGTAEDFVKVVVENAMIIDPMSVKIAAKDLTCYGENNGAVQATVTGGTPPYQYSWSNGGSESSINNLAVGTYELTIMDASDAIANATVIISAPEEIRINGKVENEKATKGMGVIEVDITGGTAPYEVKWLVNNAEIQTGSSGNRIENLDAGVYTVEVTDARGCIATANYTIRKSEHRDIAVYPNPTTGAFKVAIKASEGPYVLSIIDSRGKIVHEENGNLNADNGIEIKEFDLRSEGRGIYFVKVQYQSGVFSLKRIIVR